MALVLEGPPTTEEGVDNRAYDLSRYVFPNETITLNWQMRGATGKEQIEFKRFPSDKKKTPTKLTTAWQSGTLSIAGSELRVPQSQIFVWATNYEQNPRGCTFFV